jgi:hypothetical protein
VARRKRVLPRWEAAACPLEQGFLRASVVFITAAF